MTNKNADRYVSDVYKKMEKEINEVRGKLKAWQQVTFPVKKDGSMYASMSKRISGATYKRCDYNINPWEYELKVSGVENGVKFSDSITCYTPVHALKDEKMIAKTENYQAKVTFYHQMYLYDIEDIKQAVAKRIETLAKRLDDLEKQMQVARNACETYYDLCRAAQVMLVNMTGGETDLYWTIRRAVDSSCVALYD